MLCPSAQPTYLISNETCVSDQYLVTQCSLQLVQTEDSTPTNNITAVVIQNGFLSVLTTPSTTVPAQVVYYNQTGRSLGNCSLVSLEVYRGEGASIGISHRGFTITGGNLTIQVEEGELAYDRADYEGELYRMNVSCDDIIEDCLFFKLLSNQEVMIGNGKFNCTVLGTVAGTEDECMLTTTTRPATVRSDTQSETTNNQQTTTVAMDTTTTMTTPIETTGCTCEGVEYKSLAIGLGVVSGVFLLVILSLSVVVSYLATKLRRITTAQRLLEQIQRQGGGIAKPGTELIFANPTFNEPRYVDVDKQRTNANTNPASLDSELEDNTAYGKTPSQTRTT